MFECHHVFNRGANEALAADWFFKHAVAGLPPFGNSPIVAEKTSLLQEAGLASAGRATRRESEEEVWTVLPPTTPSDPLWFLVVPPAREFPPVDKLTRRAGDAGILPDFGSLFQEVSWG